VEKLCSFLARKHTTFQSNRVSAQQTPADHLGFTHVIECSQITSRRFEDPCSRMTHNGSSHYNPCPPQQPVSGIDGCALVQPDMIQCAARYDPMCPVTNMRFKTEVKYLVLCCVVALCAALSRLCKKGTSTSVVTGRGCSRPCLSCSLPVLFGISNQCEQVHFVDHLHQLSGLVIAHRTPLGYHCHGQNCT
jgi:hypothetical protein